MSTVEQLALIRRSLADVVSELNALVQDVQDVNGWDDPTRAELRKTAEHLTDAWSVALCAHNRLRQVAQLAPAEDVPDDGQDRAFT